MQEIRHDGSEVLTELFKDKEQTFEDYRESIMQHIGRALDNEENASVAIHGSGAIFKSQGKWYRVDPEKGLQQISWLTARRAQKSRG